jgi:hypothetical protein
MERQHTHSLSFKSIAGAALAGLGILVLDSSPGGEFPLRQSRGRAGVIAWYRPVSLANFAGQCLRSPGAFCVPPSDVGIILAAASRSGRSSLAGNTRADRVKDGDLEVFFKENRCSCRSCWPSFDALVEPWFIAVTPRTRLSALV